MAQQEFKRFVVMSQDILESPDLCTGEKLLLARYSGFKGEIYESPVETGKFLKLSAITIKRHRASLEKKGYIKCVSNNGHGKKYVVDNEKITGEMYQSDTPGVSNCYTENKIKNKREIPKGISLQQDENSFSLDVRERGPASAGETVGVLDTFVKEVLEMAGFNATPSKVREATPAAKKALSGGVTKEEIYKAAKAIKLVKEGKAGEGLTPSIRSAFQRPDFWAEQMPAEKPMGVW